MFALLVGFDLAVDVAPGPRSRSRSPAGRSGGVFALEFAVHLWLAPSRLGYLRRHWWQPLMLLLPFLRVLSFLRLARVGRALPASRVISSSNYRAAGTRAILVRSRLSYLGAVAAVGAIAVGELVYVFERDAGGAFASFGDAMLWSLSTVIAMQADPVPESVGGRIVMLFGFVLGLILIASLAGTVGSFLVDQRREQASTEGEV